MKSSLHSLLPFHPLFSITFDCDSLNSLLQLPTPELDSMLTLVKVKVKVTLRLAVYRQSFRLGVKPLENHDQIFFFD
jgi:hypothetical protein